MVFIFLMYSGYMVSAPPSADSAGIPYSVAKSWRMSFLPGRKLGTLPAGMSVPSGLISQGKGGITWVGSKNQLDSRMYGSVKYAGSLMMKTKVRIFPNRWTGVVTVALALFGTPVRV